MKQLWIALLSGILFGVGLGLSQMIDPARVLGFLDIMGDWDPTLLFVLGGAVSVTMIAFRTILRRKTPVYGSHFVLPSRQDIDASLVTGAAIFGIGWGICGYCPGPGLVGLVLGQWNPTVFVVSLIGGMFVYQGYQVIYQHHKTEIPE